MDTRQRASMVAAAGATAMLVVSSLAPWATWTVETRVAAQTAVLTPEELDKAMKRARPAMTAALKAVKSGSFSDANQQLAIVRQVIIDTQPLWIDRKKDDAVKANRDTIARIQDVEKAFASVGTPTPDEALSALRDIEAACRVCHDKYRDRDADGNWILKPGSF